MNANAPARSFRSFRRNLLRIVALLVAGTPAFAVDYVFSTGTYAPGTTAPHPLTAGNVLQINAGGFKYFDASTFTNQTGLVNWNANALYFQSGAIINNQSVWDAKSDDTLVYNGGALPTFNNTGTFRKSAGAGTTAIGAIAFVNSGIIDAQTGTINFTGANATFNAGSQFTGAGSTVVSSNAAFNGAFTSSNLSLTNGSFTGSSAQINGNVNFTGGLLTGTWQVAAGQTLSGNSGGFKYLDGAGTTFTNNGTLQWQTSNPFYFQSGAAFINNALHDFQASSSLVYNGGTLPTYLNSSSGTLRIATGQAASIGAIAFTNNGGTLQANGTLSFDGGNATFNNNTSFTGTGTNRVTSNASFQGTINSTNLLLQGGNYTGAGVGAVLSGQANYTGGLFTGTWEVGAGTVFSGNAGGFKYLDGATTTFTNNGTLQWQTSNPFYFQSGAAFINNALHDFQASSSLVYNGGAVSTYLNSSTGTMRVATGETASIGAIAFTNNGGTLQANGTLSFDGGNATFNSNTNFTGTGTNRVTSNASFQGTINSTNLLLQGGNYTGAGVGAVLSGQANYTGGLFTGTWEVGAGTVFSGNAGGFKYLDGATTTFTNNGTLQWQTSNPFYFQSGAAFINNALHDIQASTTIVNNGGALPSYTNSSTGTLKAAAGATGTIGTIAFVNNGGILQADGTLHFSGGNAQFNNNTTFSGSGTNLVTANAGFNGTITSTNLLLQSGTYTGTGGGAVLQGTTNVTGGRFAGTWNVGVGGTLNANTGGFKYLDGATLANNGTVQWQTTNSLYMENGAALNNAGLLDIQTDFTIANNGGALPTITNASAGTIRKSAGVGTTFINVPVTNNGLVDAQSGRIDFNTASGIQGTGTLQIGSAGAVTLSGPSTVGTLTHNGATATSLSLGANTLTVSNDYTNANWGSGNTFNRRANVSVTGAATNRILAAGDANQGVSGAGVANGVTTTPTLTIGNVRVGANTFNYNINNTGTTGPALRGAIQTSANGANLTDARLSGNGVTAGNWGPVGTGTGLSRDVTLTIGAAGIYAPLVGQSVNILNNFENTRSQLMTINSAAGSAAYQAAQANTLATPVNLGNVRIGGTLSAAIPVTNVAPNTGGFTETLGATVTGTTGGASTAGSISGLAQGASSNAITAGFNTATAGGRSGSATLGFTSTEINSSGLGTIGVGSQTVALTGAVYQAAQANTLATPINLGNARVGGTLSTNLGITNVAPNTGGFTETLGATVTGTTGGVTTGGSVSGLAQGASSSAISAGFSTATPGPRSGSATVGFTSSEINGSGLGTIGAGSQTVNLSGGVYRVADPLLGTINFGNVLVGSSQTRFLSVTNNAPADGFSEGLNASLGTFSGASAGILSSTGGSITNLAAGATNSSALGVVLNTSSPGTVTANVQALLASNGTGTSGLGLFTLPNQSVPISGLIQANVGNLASASAATPNPVNFGNVRVGTVVANQALSISNTLVGLGEGLNASISTATPGLTATGSFTSLAGGGTNNSSLVIGMNTATAGSRNGTATIALASDGSFNSGVTTPLAGQTVNVTGGVYRLADGSVAPSPVVVNARVGGVASAPLTVSNVAPADGYSEGLRSSAGSGTGDASVSGTTGLIAAGASGGGISVSLNTASPGPKSGTATVNHQSDGLGTSGLALIGAGSDTVNVSGSVYRAATANALPASVNVGTVRTGTVVDTALAISNTAGNTGGYTETLGASFGAVSSGLTGLGSISGLTYNAPASNAMSVRYTAGAPGAYSGTAAVGFVSQEINGSGLGNLALASQSVTVNATVNALASFGLGNGGPFTLTSGSAYSALLDFGTMSSPGSLSSLMNFLNLAIGPADSLVGSLDLSGLSGSPFSFIGSTSFNLGAGASSPFQLDFNPLTTGLFNGSIVVGLASRNAFQSDLALNSFTLNLRGNVDAGGGGGSVPDSANTALLLIMGLLGLIATRHVQRRGVATVA